MVSGDYYNDNKNLSKLNSQTGLNQKQLKNIFEKTNKLPKEMEVHPEILKTNKNRLKNWKNGEVDWYVAE